MTQDQVPANWRKGIQRALDRHVKATKCVDGTFRVHSGSRDMDYRIHPGERGKVGPCQCEASERYGKDYVCAHRGAVALGMLSLRGIRIHRPVPAVESTIRGRSQLYREAGA